MGMTIWAGSSVGRASRSQCEGRVFDSPPVHLLKIQNLFYFFVNLIEGDSFHAGSGAVPDFTFHKIGAWDARITS